MATINLPPPAAAFSNSTSGSSNPILDAVKDYIPAAAGVADAIGDSLVDAGAGFISEQADGLNKAEDAFRNDSVAAGFTELMDALSPGTAGSNALAALGLIPEDGPGKELVSAALNMSNAAFAPAAFKDLADAFGQMKGPVRGSSTGAGSAPNSVAPSHTPPAPEVQHTNTCQGPRRPAGYLEVSVKFGIGMDRMLRPGMDVTAMLACPTSALAIGPMRIFQNMFENLLLKAIEGGHCKPPETPLADRPAGDDPSIEDILGDKSLSFEDMLFMVMAKVTKDLRGEMRAEMEKLKAINGQIKDSDGEAAGQVADNLGDDPMSGARGTAGAAGGNTGMKLPLGEAAGIIDMVKPFAPMIAPLVGAACSAIPYVGPFLSAAMPVLLPVALELISGGLKAADGPVNDMFSQAMSGAGGGGKTDSASRRRSDSNQADKAAGRAKREGGGTATKGQSAGKPKSKEELQDSRQEQMEKIKMLQQKLTEMQQAISNIMNSMHKTSMNSISNIR